jgi:uroporphyrin-III C-methyltransferase
VTGTVYLVGAGPGDPRLLTLRGAEILQRADVVVHDRLVAEALLDLAPSGARRIDVGKAPGDAPVPQDEINRLLIEHAREGSSVVRLKGGDPFVFGRGGEEAIACARAGVPVEIVPGVTSAVAAPGVAGIPLTHRGVASTVAFVTASVATGPADLARVATAADTLVVLMAMRRLGDVCAALVAAGRSPDEPAALVSSATTFEQRRVIATLGTIAEDAEAAAFEPPATLVVGGVVSLAELIVPAAERHFTPAGDDPVFGTLRPV